MGGSLSSFLPSSWISARPHSSSSLPKQSSRTSSEGERPHASHSTNPMRKFQPPQRRRRLKSGRRRERVTSHDSSCVPCLIDCNDLIVEDRPAVFEFSAA